jgi:hypothetical protein
MKHAAEALAQVTEAITQVERRIEYQRMQLQRWRRTGSGDPLGEALLVVLEDCLRLARQHKAALEVPPDGGR